MGGVVSQKTKCLEAAKNHASTLLHTPTENRSLRVLKYLFTV